MFLQMEVLVSLLVSAKGFTFSEPCVVIHVREKDQQEAQFFSLIFPN